MGGDVAVAMQADPESGVLSSSRARRGCSKKARLARCAFCISRTKTFQQVYSQHHTERLSFTHDFKDVAGYHEPIP